MKKYLGLLLGSFLLAGCGMTDFSGSRTGIDHKMVRYQLFLSGRFDTIERRSAE